MGTFSDAKRDAKDFAVLVNEDTDVDTRYGGVKPSYIKKLNQLAAGFNLTPAFDFADGFIIQTRNQAGKDASGNYWIYNGTLPFEVTAGTVPSEPDYKQVTFSEAQNVTLSTGQSVQVFADSFSLKVFQSPTDGDLTEIQTRTVNAGEVYEVRKTSDDSLATIYSDDAGTIEITQDGASNVSDGVGVVEFYVSDGDYYIQSGVSDAFFSTLVTSSASSESIDLVSDKLAISTELPLLGSFGRLRKPNIKPIFDGIKAKCMQDEYYDSPVNIGYPKKSFVFSPARKLSGASFLTRALILTPASASDTFNFSLTFESNDSTPRIVELVGANGEDGTYALLSTLSPSGDIYSTSGTATGDYQFIGFRVTHNSAATGTTTAVTGLSMLVNSVSVVDFDDVCNGIIRSAGCATYDYLTSKLQRFGSVSINHYGIRTGNTSFALWASPSATKLTGDTSAFSNELVGTKDNPATINECIEIAEGLNYMGMDKPIICLGSGVYDGVENSRANAIVRADQLANGGQDLIIVSPFGQSQINSNGVTSGIFNFDNTPPASGRFDFYLMGIDWVDFPLPLRFYGYGCYAYQVTTNSGSAETGSGVKITYSDSYWQECTFTGSSTDGIANNISGHIALIDCVSHSHLDDGFSPHDKCTYEVWDGEYYNNGKGNITPAFGAQGYCVRVSSHDANGTGPNINGNNYGGFVCLSGGEDSGNTLRPTIMELYDCESDNDIFSVNSAGAKSHVFISGTTMNNASISALSQQDWNNKGYGQIYELRGNKFNGNNVDREINDEKRYIFSQIQID